MRPSERRSPFWGNTALKKTTKLLRLLVAGSYRSAIIRHRVAAAVEHERALAGLACRTVIDVGANRGQFALVARRSFPGARIVSFEPLPDPVQCFRQVFCSDPRVVIHPVAVTAASGEAIIHVSQKDDSSSLLPISALQAALFPGTAEVRTQRVRTGRLSEFIDAESIEPPALLKLDVQGYELEALKGCQDLVERFGYVYAECSFLELYEGQALAGEVTEWLRARGLQLRGVHNTVYDRHGQAIQADFLFARWQPKTPGS